MKYEQYVGIAVVVFLTIVFVVVMLFSFVSISSAENHKVVGIHTYEYCRNECGEKNNCLDAAYEISEYSCHMNYDCSKCLDKCDEMLQEYRNNYKIEKQNEVPEEVTNSGVIQ